VAKPHEAARGMRLCVVEIRFSVFGQQPVLGASWRVVAAGGVVARSKPVGEVSGTVRSQG